MERLDDWALRMSLKHHSARLAPRGMPADGGKVVNRTPALTNECCGTLKLIDVL